MNHTSTIQEIEKLKAREKRQRDALHNLVSIISHHNFQLQKLNEKTQKEIEDFIKHLRQ